MLVDSFQGKARPAHLVPDALALLAIWLLAIVIVNPLGNFPLNDDWSYGKAVAVLLREGAFRPTGWTAMTLFSQALWGALFCLPFGFSFTALRVSTLVLGLVAVLCLHRSLREMGVMRAAALTASLSLALNPVYFALSHTFMTDVPFLSFMILASFFFVRALRTRSDASLVAATILSSAAVLCRQVGLALPVAFAAGLLVARGVSPRQLARAVLPAATGLLTLWVFESIMKSAGGLPVKYEVRAHTFWLPHVNLASLASILEWNLVKAILYLGLFLLPPLISMGNPFKPLQRARSIVGLLLAFLFVAGAAKVMMEAQSLMPLGGNVLSEEGIGPAALRDIYLLELPRLRSLPSIFWWGVTALALLGGVLLIGSMSRAVGHLLAGRKREERREPLGLGVFFLVGVLGYATPFLLIDYFDRHLLPLIPLLLLSWAAGGHLGTDHDPGRAAEAPRPRRWVRAPSIALGLVLAMGVYSIAGTRDYLTFQRTRWKALSDLVETNSVAPDRIDGGFEFDGWYLYDPSYKDRPGKSWWWVHDDEYIVAMGPIDGYDVIHRYGFRRWLVPGEQSITVLHRSRSNP